MRILFRLRYAELCELKLADIFAEGFVDLLRRERDRQLLQFFVIARRADIVERKNPVSALKAAEVLAGESVSDLSGPVGAEIEENNAVSGFYHAVPVADDGLDEFIRHTLCIAFLHRRDGIRILYAFAVDEGAVGFFKPVPALIPVHAADALFCGVCLSRNRGHQNALLAGLMTAKDRADVTISMLMNGSVPYEFRTTLVRGLHSREDIENIGALLNGAKNFYLQNFEDSGDLVGFADSGAQTGLSGFSAAELEEFKRILEKYAASVSIRN